MKYGSKDFISLLAEQVQTDTARSLGSCLISHLLVDGKGTPDPSCCGKGFGVPWAKEKQQGEISLQWGTAQGVWGFCSIYM